MAYAVSIYERTIREAFECKPFHHRWKFYRFRWLAKLVVWYINTLGAGRDYEFARYLGETL